MKENTKGWWIVAVILGLVLVWAGANIIWLVRATNRARAAHQSIVKSDHAALLAACRQLIANGERTMYRDRKEYGSDVPAIIRDMDPWWIAVDTNAVRVFVCGPPRTGFVGFIEGAGDGWMREGNGCRKLIDGLWMFER